MLKQFESRLIAGFHDGQLAAGPAHAPNPGAGSRTGGGLDAWSSIAANHRYNNLLWDEEDKARRTDVGPDAIAHGKRLIDRYNQKRNDAVEAIDEALLFLLAAAPAAANARLHSETAGAMIDRLSILSLKIFHMREQSCRAGASAGHLTRCAAKLARLNTQRADLCACFDQLLQDASAGRAYFKLYRQFKMYNDPALNPYLYGRRRDGAGGAAP
ncbi:MAG: DUF4254 domain-containing protein [Burkholderiaceae bacterium]|nr:DUF4254 domain-containing protein [Burkholderiaceae bacterium]